MTRRLLVSVVAALATICCLGAAPAGAASPAPGWTLHSMAVPTTFSVGGNKGQCSKAVEYCNGYQVTATNAGSVVTSAGITLSDTLPAGATLLEVKLHWPSVSQSLEEDGGHPPNVFPQLVEKGLCTPSPLRCQTPPGAPYTVAPDETIEMQVYLGVDEAELAVLTNSATISGGGAAAVSTTSRAPLGGPAPGFGVASLSTLVAGPDGAPEAEAGSHPYEFTTRIDLNTQFRYGPSGTNVAQSVEDPKDIVVDLPLGLLGSAVATPQCTFAQLASHAVKGVSGCPTNTVVGHLLTEPKGGDEIDGPIYNMVPEHGVAAEFGVVDAIGGPHVLYAKVVPSLGGYVLRTTAPELPQVELTDIVANFFGEPATRDGGGGAATVMFTNPSQCNGQALDTSVHMDSWQRPGAFDAQGEPVLASAGWTSAEAATFPEGLEDCNLLQFTPTLGAQPEPLSPGAADAPAGFSFDLSLPQPELPDLAATPPLRDAVVTLPAGLTVDPSSAGGLQACSEAQIGYTGQDSETGAYEFSDAPPACPEGSKIGTVELTTPLLAGTLHGSVYLASQTQNPFGSLLAGYIVVDDVERGVVVKLPGELRADPATGQITGSFKDNPQFPFDDLKLRFKGGPRGVLATPESCGTYTTTSQLTPWSAPDSGPPATPSDSFQTTSGCVSGFAPAVTGGTTNPKAGAYSPLVLSFSRGDVDQEISSASISMPPGVLAKVAGVARCSDAEIAAAAADPSGADQTAHPSCPAGSRLGSVQAASGPGPDPYVVAGSAYLAGPYRGAPYSLAVIVPAVAGPFDLGNVVVRSALYIDPSDGHVTAVTDPFPTMVNASGIPVRLRRVDVTIDRPEFAFNPTSCEPMSIAATLTSTQGLTSTATPRFQVGECQSLPFKPSFQATTSAKTSKLNGASLVVRVTQKPGESGIRQVKVQLPKALPSRVSTLNKACLAAQFDANPAGCPEGSVVGTATAVTPVLSVPLTGPAYLVSHGSAGFPDLEFVLQGEGVTIVLDGKTDIKKGITYSKFETVPDAPISSFETVLPQGPHSILGAYESLCAQPLTMPTTIVGQNGAVIEQNTAIAVQGCANGLSVLSRTVSARTLTLKVSVPGPGRLTASGKSLKGASRKVGSRSTVTLKLTKLGAGKLRSTVKLRFVPAKGRPLSKAVSVTFKG